MMTSDDFQRRLSGLRIFRTQNSYQDVPCTQSHHFYTSCPSNRGYHPQQKLRNFMVYVLNHRNQPGIPSSVQGKRRSSRHRGWVRWDAESNLDGNKRRFKIYQKETNVKIKFETVMFVLFFPPSFFSYQFLIVGRFNL